MVLKVGINGFGRIGRVIFRKCLEDSDLEVKAINDPAVDIEYICYLIKFDSTHGRLKYNITFSDNEIKINDSKIKVFHEKTPSNIPWHIVSIQYVVEASGIFTNYDKASGHLSSQSVKRVLVTAPSIDVPMLIIGVNEDRMKKDQKVISCASSTLYCLAPIIKILEDNYRVAEGYITSIHAMTPSLKPLDGLCLRGKHWRDHRSIHQNIIPAATGACKALGKIIPGVRDKLTGLAFRVPVVNVSVLDITVRLIKSTSILDIVKCIDDQGSSTMKNVIKTCSDEAVSSDFLGEENSCILDINSCLQLTPNFFKLICWYENEYSYACRVVDSIKFLEKVSHLDLVSQIAYTRLAGSDRLSKSRPLPFCNRGMYCNSLIQNRSRLCLSQNTVFKQKLSPTHLCSRQNLILHNSGPNQSICDLNQITNNTQNVSSFFQKCVLDDSSEREIKAYLKTQERLEEVKKEFSKIADMTEKLLNTSKNNKLGLEFCTPNETIEDKISKLDSLHKGHVKMPFNTSSNNLVISKDLQIHENVEIDNRKKNKSLLNEISKVSDLKILPENNDCLNMEIKPDETKDKTVFENKKCYVDNLGNLENIKRDEVQINDSICIAADSKREIENESYINKDVDDVHFSPNNKSKELEINESCSNSGEAEKEDKLGSKESLYRSAEIKKKIIEGIIKKLSKESTEETNKINLIYTNSSIINNTGNKFNDIYDKLDSTSATDSENSFQIHERKSQVIEITDLTNSINDLARLDKICRIIEISDELSDRLFSALDNKQQDYKRTKWCFKDLCENIKLDEFCNKVFGS